MITLIFVLAGALLFVGIAFFTARAEACILEGKLAMYRRQIDDPDRLAWLSEYEAWVDAGEDRELRPAPAPLRDFAVGTPSAS